MTPERLYEALKWGPLSDVRIRKAQRHASPEVVAAVVKRIQDEQQPAKKTRKKR